MAGFYLSSAMMLFHIPTLLLLVGYPVYWIELYFFPHPTGHTTYLAPLVFLFMLAVVVWHQFCRREKHFNVQDLLPCHGLGWICAGISFLMLSVMAMASLLPPHLCQEFDVINYHITIPRQHLMLGSFAHLPWSTADLFLLPIDFALAPFWLMTELPNKYPQFLFFMGLPFVAGSLTMKLSGDRVKAWMAGFLVLGAHGIAIQGGTAMLDVVLCYLFIAALDSFLRGNVVLAAVELAFFVFAKPAMPVMFIAVLAAVVLLWWVSCCKTASWGFSPVLAGGSSLGFKKFTLYFLCAAVCVGGPFMVKSTMYAGTPFYPIGAGMSSFRKELPSALRVEIDQRGREHLRVKDAYGASRGVKDFLAHFWLIAVPEKDVNNRFDYPLGLPLLLVIIPFFFFLVRSCGSRNFPLLPVLCVVYWLFWWQGSQQSRFLFVPMVLMIIAVVVEVPRLSRILWVCVVLALGFTALSVYRAHAAELGKRPEQVLRSYDHQLLSKARSVKPGDFIEVDTPDVAFAPFLVDVKKEYGFYVLTP